MGHIFLSFLFYNLLVFLFYIQYRKGRYYIGRPSLLFYTVLFIAFGTYGGGEGDYLHYKEAVESIHSLGDIFFNRGMEMQYYYLAYILGGNYTLWRLVVFSIQFLGLGWFLYKAKLNTYPVLFVFTTLFLVTSVYGRVYWGGIYFFMGLYLLIEKKNPLFLFFVALCYVSHTSNLILIALLPLGFINLKRWHIVVFIVLFGFIIGVFNEGFSQFLDSGGIEGADYLNDKVDKYSNNASFVSGFWGDSIGEKVIFVLRHFPLLIILVKLLNLFMGSYNKYEHFYKPLRSVINVYFGLNMASMIFLFADMETGTFFYRVLAMTYFPVTIILPYLSKNGFIKKRSFNILLLLFLLASEANYFKDLYYFSEAGIW